MYHNLNIDVDAELEQLKVSSVQKYNCGGHIKTSITHERVNDSRWTEDTALSEMLIVQTLADPLSSDVWTVYTLIKFFSGFTHFT